MFLCSLESSSRNKNVVEKIFENFLNFFAFFDQNVILAPTQKSQIRRQNFFPKSGLNCTLVPLDYGNISFWMSQEGKQDQMSIDAIGSVLRLLRTSIGEIGKTFPQCSVTIEDVSWTHVHSS